MTIQLPATLTSSILGQVLSGITGFRRFSLGSVAESVMKSSRIPVLVVRRGSTEFCMAHRA